MFKILEKRFIEIIDSCFWIQNQETFLRVVNDVFVLVHEFNFVLLDDSALFKDSREPVQEVMVDDNNQN